MRVLEEVYNELAMDEMVSWFLLEEDVLHVVFFDDISQDDMIAFADEKCEIHALLDYEYDEGNGSIDFFEHDPLDDIYGL
jgi:hypothetical protein